VYENHNQVDYGPLKVRAVRGTGIVEVGDKTQPGRAVPGACLSLFTEKKHKFLASVVADSKGQFRFDAVPPGRYRLVARANAFCVANIPLEVVRSSRKKAEILVHFRPGGIDTCSYGDLAVSKRDGSSPALLILNRVPLRTPTIPTQTVPPRTPSLASSSASSTPVASAPACSMTPSTAKVAQNTQFLITATVTSSKPLTGTVTFYNFGSPIVSGIPLTNGQAQTGSGYINNPGLYQITAAYSGDANNLPSTSAALTQVITGTFPVTLQGSTGGDVHYLQLTLGVQ